MKHATTSGTGVRALREFGLALRSGPFRVALVLSLIVHLALLVAIGRGGSGRPGAAERRIPLMRVRLLSPGPAPAAVPVVPANNPALRQPRREQPGRPAAAALPQQPAPRALASVRRRIDAHKVYPQIAVRNGRQGRVLVEMRLEGDGRLSAVRLLEGSGYAVLDDATSTAVQQASPFPPVARVLTVPVEYRLQ